MANASDNVRTPVLKTIPQAAAYLGVSDRTMRRYVKAGKIGTLLVDGQTRVQQVDLDNLAALDRHTPALVQDNDRHLSAPAEDVLRETVRRQDAEISYLRTELTAIRTTLDRVTLMLPAATDTPMAARATRTPAWLWVVLMAVLAAAGMGGYWLWLTR